MTDIGVCSLEPNAHLSAFLLQQSPDRRAQPGPAELEPLISAQTGKILRMCFPRFPGILNKYFPKLGIWLGNHHL